MWIVDKAFPAHCSAWLFKIHPHHDIQTIGVLQLQLLELLGVFDSRNRIMN